MMTTGWALGTALLGSTFLQSRRCGTMSCEEATHGSGDRSTGSLRSPRTYGPRPMVDHRRDRNSDVQNNSVTTFIIRSAEIDHECYNNRSLLCGFTT